MYGIINYKTALGCILMIRQVIVKPKESAIIKCIYHDNCYPEKHNIELTGEEYKVWADNDDYLAFICLQKINPSDKIAEIEQLSIPQVDDSRSVHNNNDLERISSLELELEEQRKKLQTIMSLLGKTAI